MRQYNNHNQLEDELIRHVIYNDHYKILTGFRLVFSFYELYNQLYTEYNHGWKMRKEREYL